MSLTDVQRRALRILARGRSNVHHVAQQGGFGDSEAKRVLTGLCTAGLALEVDRDLYAITQAGRETLDGTYPDEAGFLQDVSVIHDAPSVKTLRLHGERRPVAVQVDEDSVALLAETATDLLAVTREEGDCQAGADSADTN
jgi:hypothetical protein